MNYAALWPFVISFLLGGAAAIQPDLVTAHPTVSVIIGVFMTAIANLAKTPRKS